MRRWIGITSVVLSLLLFSLALAVWVRSCFVFDRFTWRDPDGPNTRVRVLVSHGGGLVIGEWRETGQLSDFTEYHVSRARLIFGSLWFRYTTFTRAVGYPSTRPAAMLGGWMFTTPLWTIAVIAIMPSVYWLWRRRRARRAKREGFEVLPAR